MNRLALLVLLWLAAAGLVAHAQPDDDSEPAPATQSEPSNGIEASEDSADTETTETASRDEEFKPREEISEDFPVALPADI